MQSLKYALAAVSIFMLSQNSITAQTPAPVDVPPSPNAAALGEFGKVPVGLFTGTVQQSIPLYTISFSDYALPLTLDYRSNGVMVRDAGSNAGIGWALNAGGIITRMLRDEKDEFISSRITVPAVSFDSPEMNNFLYSATSSNTLDGEPDIFSFNFGKYAGKFYLTGTSGNMQAVLIEPSPLKIEFLSDFYSDNSTGPAAQIRITDPEGIVYLFGGTAAIEDNTSRTYFGTGSVNIGTARARTAWYLTKIILLNNEEITFTYSGRNLFYDAGISQTVSSTVTSHNDYTKAVHTLPVLTRVNSATSKLTTIEWKAGKIDFTYSPRFDANSDMEKIDKIVINAKNFTRITPLKQYTFNYLLASTMSAYNNPDNNGIFNDNHRRLFLTSLISLSATGTELNRYSFEYYNPTELPTRLSYAIDHWGYFNGGNLNGQQNKDLVPKDLSFYNEGLYQYPGSYPKNGSPGIIDAFSAVGANKNPDAQFGVKGLLKRITYPTGGYTDLEYESHSSGMELAPLTKVDLNWSPNNTYTTVSIPFDQRVELIPSITYVTASCDKTNPIKVDYTLSVVELPSNTPVSILKDGQLTATPINIPAGSGSKYFVDFKQGKTYKVSISINTYCTTFTSTLTFSYATVPPYYLWVKNKPIGGMRISKITNSDLTGNQEIKRFYYATDLSCLTCSSGKARMADPEPSISYYESLVLNNGAEYRTLTANLTSEPLNDLYNSQGYHISYFTVIEGIGNNFEGGAIVHNYNYVEETLPKRFRDPVVGAPFNNVFGNGEELKTTYYKKVGAAFTKVKEVANTYASDIRLNNSISAFRANRRSYNYIGDAVTYNLSTYSITSQWRYLSSTSETTFDANGGNGSVVKTFYVYDNILHMQPTSFSMDFEKFGTYTHSVITLNRYPNDFTFTGSLSGSAAVMKTMADRHMFTVPIEKVKYSFNVANVSAIESKLSTYKMNGNFIVKDKDYGGKFNNFTMYQDLVWMNTSSINASGQFTYDNHYEPLVSYNRYDDKNKLLELTDREITSSFIREPITGDVWAKAENCTNIEIAYSSFDHSTSQPSSFTNWNYNLSKITAGISQNGTKSFNLNGAGQITNVNPLTASQKYKLSFWRYTGSGTTLTLASGSTTFSPRLGPQRNGWQYIEYIVTGVASIQLSGTYTIDELRLCPVGGRMKTYVFTDGVGVTSECNENNQQLFYEYDEFNRLKLTRDQNKNILQKNEYKFQN